MTSFRLFIAADHKYRRRGSSVAVAIVAGQAVVTIPTDILMLIIHVGAVVFMTIYATENSIVGRIGMAIGTGVPFTAVLPGIYRKILVVMVPGGRTPRICNMALIAGNGKLCGEVGRIGGLVIIALMTTDTGIRGVLIISLVTGTALRGNQGMRPGKRVDAVMVKTSTDPRQGIGTVTIEAGG